MIIYEKCHTKIGCLRFIFEENSKLRRIVLTEEHWHAVTAKHTTKRSQELGKPICRKFQQ